MIYKLQKLDWNLSLYHFSLSSRLIPSTSTSLTAVNTHQCLCPTKLPEPKFLTCPGTFLNSSGPGTPQGGVWYGALRLIKWTRPWWLNVFSHNFDPITCMRTPCRGGTGRLSLVRSSLASTWRLKLEICPFQKHKTRSFGENPNECTKCSLASSTTRGAWYEKKRKRSHAFWRERH